MDTRRQNPYLRPASSVSACISPWVGAPQETLDSEDFSDSFDADAGTGGGKKHSLHGGARGDMDKTTKNVEDAVNIIDLLRNT